MAELIKVNTERLRSDASDIKDYLQIIEKDIEQLRLHSTALSDIWGEAGSEAFEQDLSALYEAIKHFSVLNEYENNAVITYDECEYKVGTLVDQIKVR